MNNDLKVIISLLNQISVRGDDVDRLFLAKQKINQLYIEHNKSPLKIQKELSHNDEHTNNT